MSSNVIKLSDKLNDATKYTPLDMLEEVIERIEKNPQIRKVIVIMWDETANFADQILWHTVGTTREEHLHMLSRAKDEYLIDYALEHTH